MRIMSRMLAICALLVVSLVLSSVFSIQAHADAGSPSCQLDGYTDYCMTGGNPATPWWFGEAVGSNPQDPNYPACSLSDYNTAISNGNAGHYSSPQTVANAAAQAYGGSVASITYTTAYVDLNEYVIPSYVIDLTNSACLDSFYGVSDPATAVEAVVAQYDDYGNGDGDNNNYGQVCPDFSYVPIGQSCSGSPSACPAGKTLSGPSWVAKFPTSTSTSDLVEPFRDDVNSFLAALSEAGASVRITATYRPPQRAYLMHYAYEIAKKGLNPASVPARDDVAICWVHTNADGSANVAASKKAALQMVKAYGIVHEPALTSNHTKGLAIDMNISWSGKLRIANANGKVITISTSPRSGMNRTLWKVGATYGVFKLASDRPHWSYNGH